MKRQVEAARRCGDRWGEAVIHWSLGVRHRLGQHLREARDHYEAARGLFDGSADQLGVAYSLSGLGLTFLRDRRLDVARVEFERGLAIARDQEVPFLVAVLLRNLGFVDNCLGHLAEAQREFQQAIATYRELGEVIQESFCLPELAEVLIERRQLAEARDSLDRAFAHAEAHDNTLLEGLLFLQQGRLELAQGSSENALISSQHAAVLLRQFGYQGFEAEALHVTGEAYRQLGRLDYAANFSGGPRKFSASSATGGALDNLATTLSRLNKPDHARQAWREAQSLLTDVDGARAARLRTRVDQRLSSG